MLLKRHLFSTASFCTTHLPRFTSISVILSNSNQNNTVVTVSLFFPEVRKGPHLLSMVRTLYTEMALEGNSQPNKTAAIAAFRRQDPTDSGHRGSSSNPIQNQVHGITAKTHRLTIQALGSTLGSQRIESGRSQPLSFAPKHRLQTGGSLVSSKLLYSVHSTWEDVTPTCMQRLGVQSSAKSRTHSTSKPTRNPTASEWLEHGSRLFASS